MANHFEQLLAGHTESNMKEKLDVSHMAQSAHCIVEKHYFLGCAIVKVASKTLRDAVLHYIHLHDSFNVSGVNVHLAEHVPRAANEKSDNALFAGWGRKTERRCPISATTLAAVVDGIILTLLSMNPAASFAPLPEEMPTCRLTCI
eukprot:TRINITY_DN132_c0_g1_i4.p2 TRINITY_DN132_c0_g1~~TRINITY_DN132_c0_g1_i4.p2  ORF type:complete len:146 (-),score=27.29 TRINITY_DN132_c0_g1_i4:836-1273(-)